MQESSQLSWILLLLSLLLNNKGRHQLSTDRTQCINIYMPQNQLGKKHLSLIFMLFTLHWQRVHSVPCLIQEDPVKRMTLVSSRQVLVMSLRMVSAWQGSVTQRGQHSFSGRTLNSQSTSGHGKGQQSTSPCCLQIWWEQEKIISSYFLLLSIPLTQQYVS